MPGSASVPDISYVDDVVQTLMCLASDVVDVASTALSILTLECLYFRFGPNFKRMKSEIVASCLFGEMGGNPVSQ